MLVTYPIMFDRPQNKQQWPRDPEKFGQKVVDDVFESASEEEFLSKLVYETLTVMCNHT